MKDKFSFYDYVVFFTVIPCHNVSSPNQLLSYDFVKLDLLVYNLKLLFLLISSTPSKQKVLEVSIPRV
ncbi:hypothetical protein IC575_029886 [Cucumis melo]